MSKHRIYEIAKEYNTTSKVIIDILARNNITAKNHMSSVDETARGVVERTFARKTEPAQSKTETPAAQKTQIRDAKMEQKPQEDRQKNKEELIKQPEKATAPLQQRPVQTQAALNKPNDQRSYQPRQQPNQQSSQQPRPGALVQGQQQRPPRQDGQQQQHRPQQQGGQGQQKMPPRPNEQGQQQRPPQQSGQGQQQRPPQQGGQGQQQRPQQQGGQQQRPFQQNNRPQQGGRNEGQQASNQTNRQQPPLQPGQQRPGFAPQAGTQSRPAVQQRSFGSNERRTTQPGQANTGQNQRQFTNAPNNQYAGQGRPQPQRTAQPDRRGTDGARLSQPSSTGNNRQFAPQKPNYAGAQAAPKQPATGSGTRPPQKNKDRQTHPNQRGVAVKSEHETESSRKNRPQFQSRSQRQAPQQPQSKPEMPKPKTVKLGDAITVKDLAGKIAREVSEVIKKLMGLGIMATINQEIDFDTASLIAGEFGVTVEELPPVEDPTEIPELEDNEKDLVYRSPVVTVMGHVDHGKTSLLDSIRQTNVIAQEAGGITQHIGAYQVMCQNKKIVFLDTPGHEAFTAMRARGAQITDIAILVVAADDGVMPQTLEAINHAKSAKVPIIVAINKMDRAGANPDRVKQQLSENGLIPEDWGGDTVMVPVSAYKKTGINELLEMILLVAEMLDLKANPNRKAYGTVIEAKLDKGRGPVSTILVQKGTLKIGDSIIAGAVFGKVRAMTNDRGEKVKKAEPSTPVEVLGLADVPLAGDIMVAVDDKTARAVSEKRAVKKRSEELKQSHKVSLDDLFKQIQEGSLKDLNIVVKADVQGSIEALAQSITGLKNKEVRVNVIHTGVGAINESDVMLASASNALIIGFNVRPDTNARRVADNEKVDIRTYRVIYEAINDVEAAITGMLAPEYKEVIYGRLEIRQLISVPKAIVAGSYVLEGKVTNNSQIRLIRDGIVIYEGRIESLRRFKDDVKEVSQGYECGLTIEKYRDIKEGDILESFGMEQVANKTKV